VFRITSFQVLIRTITTLGQLEALTNELAVENRIKEGAENLLSMQLNVGVTIVPSCDGGSPWFNSRRLYDPKLRPN
jgi:hypothetical protein